ncbi:hypothetical protein EIP91_001694 [Steccherinum ochraceum]|uniref:Uncharacterized protein n=1 Tax=Steccherinum ochraceum TaxID=92696 RepID=A0A4R0RDD9_9APHY|nr:hypothetical protein EIP91_001694 [Steccherinum ochraceum]
MSAVLPASLSRALTRNFRRSQASPPWLASSPLLSLPTELFRPIFYYACTDDGRIGCAINAVCKLLPSVCLDTGADLQYASICGTDRMKKFLEMLRGRDVAGRRVVSLVLRRDEPATDMKEHVFLLFSILSTITSHHLRILEHADSADGGGDVACAEVGGNVGEDSSEKLVWQ